MERYAAGGRNLFAPDTRKVATFAVLDRGHNYHGSLLEEMFVCRDRDTGYEWTVLWVSLNASQAEDDVQRLAPFCMLSAWWLPDDLEDEIGSVVEEFEPLELEGLILFWAYANYCASWATDYLERAQVKAGWTSSEIIDSVFDAGREGTPLNLKKFLRGQNKPQGSSESSGG